MSTDIAQEVMPATEFSGTELAALRERREAVTHKWVEAVRAEQATGEDRKVTMDAGLSSETLEAIERFQREFEALSATIKTQEQAKEQADLVKAEEDLTKNAPRYRDMQAKRDAQFFDNLMAVGRGEYKASDPDPDPDPRGGSHPGALAIPQPLVAKNPYTGKNEVHPFSAVFTGKNGNRQANVEASFRQAEMIAADQYGRYDPETGKRVSAHKSPVGKQLEAELGFGIAETVADTYLRQGGMLYLYEIQRNELAQYMDIKQVPYVNEFIIDRRTAVLNPAASPPDEVQKVAEGGAISVVDSVFDSITITPRKFAFLRGMTYESSQLQEPWSVAQTIMTDSGIAMGNKFGEDIVTGAGSGPGGTDMSATWQGLITWAKVSGNANNKALGAHGTFLNAAAATNTMGNYEFATFLTQLPKEYFRSPNKLLSMRLATWGRLMGVEDLEGRKLFNPMSDLESMGMPLYNLRVVIDENWDAGTAANEVPWFYGDFTGACFVMYGPVRVDFSKEHGYTTDRLYWRFIAHRGFAIVDPNGMFGGMLRT